MRPPPNPHAVLEPFADGELPAEEAARFRQHLAGCLKCRAGLHAQVQLEGMAQHAMGKTGDGG